MSSHNLSFLECARPVLERLVTPDLEAKNIPTGYLVDLYDSDLHRITSPEYIGDRLETYLMTPMRTWRTFQDIGVERIEAWRKVTAFFPIIARMRYMKDVKDASKEGLMLWLEVDIPRSQSINKAWRTLYKNKFTPVLEAYRERAHPEAQDDSDRSPDQFLTYDVFDAVLNGEGYLRNLRWCDAKARELGLLREDVLEEYRNYFAFLAEVLLPNAG